jgi:hypothetical protein
MNDPYRVDDVMKRSFSQAKEAWAVRSGPSGRETNAHVREHNTRSC